MFNPFPFSPNKDAILNRRLVREALFTLNEYFEGRAKQWEVDRALDELEEIYGSLVLLPTQLFKEGMKEDMEAKRLCRCYEAIRMIEKVALGRSTGYRT